MRTCTPRAAASRIASPTSAPVSVPRWKSYCARSSEVRASATKSATSRATSSAPCAASVRVRTVIALVDELVGAEIGDTFNFYRDGVRAALLRRRLRTYLAARAGAPVLLVGEAAGYRGARVSGLSVHLGAAAHRRRPG